MLWESEGDSGREVLNHRILPAGVSDHMDVVRWRKSERIKILEV